MCEHTQLPQFGNKEMQSSMFTPGADHSVYDVGLQKESVPLTQRSRMPITDGTDSASPLSVGFLPNSRSPTDERLKTNLNNQ